MTELERTKDAALRILQELRDEEIQELDESNKATLSRSLLQEVFEQAWRYQFEEDRRQAKKAIRELVRDAIDESQLGENQ